MKQIYLEFEGGPRAIATLNLEHAPITCATLWNALENPVTVKAVHAMFAGPEIMTGLPEQARSFDPLSIPPENQQVIAGAGEVLWYFQQKNHMKGLTDELWEIGVFYADGGRTFGPLGWSPCNYWARITEGLDEFAKACNDMRFTGAKNITYSRVPAGS